MTTLQATKAYRSNLQNSLREAKKHLSAAQYSVVSAGLAAEIDNLDRQLEDLRFKAFMGCSEEIPLFPRVMQIVQRAYARVEIDDTPSISSRHMSLETNQIRQHPLTSRRASGPSSYEPSSLSMDLRVAHCT
jgi:hypothetical protein